MFIMNDVVDKYVNQNYSIEKLCAEYSVGKLKIKEILKENNVEIKKRGKQVKYINNFTPPILTDKVLICKKCGKIHDDVINKSGSITKHIQSCFPNVDIPSSFKRREYTKNTGEFWHIQFFTVEGKVRKEYLNCPICDWKTPDLKNRTGALTKHIEGYHNISIDSFVKDHPNYSNYFYGLTALNNRVDEFNKSDDNYITCKICDEQFKILSNSHLRLHEITQEKYKELYGSDSLISNKTRNFFKDNLLSSDNRPIFKSSGEMEIIEFLSSLGVDVIQTERKILNGIELDIFLPKYNIAIEYNGLYWHSEKRGKHRMYHLEKTKKCLEKDIRLIHIFSDEWLNKKEIIKDRLKYLINFGNKIYARKCEIVTLTKNEKKEFLIRNHLQGNDNSSIFYGLKFKDEIVSVITFGKLRKILGSKNNDDNIYELYRYCSKNVIGGFSKLFNHFLKLHNPQKIITYADRNWTPSDDFSFYGKLGFKFVDETKPNYSYTLRYDKREHRFNYRKDILIKKGYDKSKSETEIMLELGFDRIWDTGNLKYEYIGN